MKKRLFSLLLVFALILSFCVTAFADFGDYAGDNDYGDNYGGYDSYDSYDSDDDYNYYDSYDDDDNDKNISSYYSYIFDSHGDDDGFGGYYNSKLEKISLCTLERNIDTDKNMGLVGFTFLVAVVGSIAVAIVRKKRKNNRGNRDSRPAGAQATDITTLNNMAKYKKIDPNFSEPNLKEKLSNIYVQMQNGWQDKNIEQLRPYFTDALFAQFNRQLDTYRRNRQTNYIERIAVLDVDLMGWKQESGVDTIIATMRTRIVDYVVDDNTGKVLRGSKTAEKFMTYEWTLTRKSGVKTGVNSGVKVITCPNCGATVDINKSAKCEYCGSVITVEATDWTINGIKGISQRTM